MGYIIRDGVIYGGGGGAEIDDTATASDKVWSSQKTNSEINSKAEIDDTSTANNKTWSANKIGSEINSRIGDALTASY